jgi:uncharacterized membrane protein YsdA (DUF1294 family)/cold shock CspA family protein
MRVKGKIASWNDDKGYGFIAPLGGGSQVFVHIKAFQNRNRRPEINNVVTYDVDNDEQGRIRAENATLAGDKLTKGQGHSKSSATPAVVMSALFLAAVGISIGTGNLRPQVLVAYLAISVFTFVVYAFDKSAAQNGRWRTSEGSLHFLALVGGWPGAWVAQQALRHKSKKTEFRIVFWVTVLLNCGGLIWLHTSVGRAWLYQLTG